MQGMPTIHRSLLLLACLALYPPALLAEEALQELAAGAVARQDKAAAGRLTKQAVRNAGKLEREALYATAQAAVFAERIADAHFLYHAGQMRERAELAAFPPIDPRRVPAMQDGLRQQTAETVDPLMVSHSQTFIEAVKRLQKWQPAYPKNYKPDWLFDVTRGREISAAVEQVKMEHLAVLEDLAWLLGDEKYLQALRAHQAYLLAPEEEQTRSRRKAENAAAEKFMLDLEKASGRQGYMSLR